MKKSDVYYLLQLTTAKIMRKLDLRKRNKNFAQSNERNQNHVL